MERKCSAFRQKFWHNKAEKFECVWLILISRQVLKPTDQSLFQIYYKQRENTESFGFKNYRKNVMSFCISLNFSLNSLIAALYLRNRSRIFAYSSLNMHLYLSQVSKIFNFPQNPNHTKFNCMQDSTSTHFVGPFENNCAL